MLFLLAIETRQLTSSVTLIPITLVTFPTLSAFAFVFSFGISFREQ